MMASWNVYPTCKKGPVVSINAQEKILKDECEELEKEVGDGKTGALRQARIEVRLEALGREMEAFRNKDKEFMENRNPVLRLPRHRHRQGESSPR